MNFDYGNYYDDNKEKIPKNKSRKKKEDTNNLKDEKVDIPKKKESKKNKKKLDKYTIISINLVVAIIVVIILMFIPSDVFENKKEPIEEDNKTQNVDADIQIIDVNSNTRPFAIMINCHNNSLPQSGLQDAYIVYELMVEAGITRMMALFKDQDFTKVGSIRSARTQYLGYVLENDAIYVHAGGAKDALKRISEEKFDDIDVDGVYGERDTKLKRDYEHTLFTNTTLLKKAIDDKKMRSTTSTGSLLTYTKDELDFSDNGQIANEISIKYSSYRTSKYVYDPIMKTYLRYMNDKENIDLVTKEPYRIKNIIAYAVKYSTYTYDNSTTQYQKIDNIGTGEGYYITNGYSIPITWEKKDESSKTIYKNKLTGEVLQVNDGNTYIQIYPTSGKLEIK